MSLHRWFCSMLLLVLSVSHSLGASNPVVDPLTEGLRPFLEALGGRQAQFELKGSVKLPIDGKEQTVALQLVRFDDESFDLTLTHSDYAVSIRRRRDVTTFALPLHHVAYVGHGAVDSTDCLKVSGLTNRLLSSGSQVASIVSLFLQADANAVSVALRTFAGVEYDADAKRWKSGKISLGFPSPGNLNVVVQDARIDLSVVGSVSEMPDAVDWPDMKVVEIDREELERQLVRGVRRASEILAPSPLLTNPPQSTRKVANGELRWIDGQRVALLHGSPEEVGHAHGELLKVEAGRCIDSVLYTFGTAQTIRTGRWFRSDLEAAYQRLSPHIPDRHKRETRAMAAALDLDPELVEALNVFPELFHCSGFAVFGKATVGGKLYHGRVLDYMTTIGLQDSATTFIVNVDGQIPFANVGYAGFIGSVSGMNAKAISLGEMGGRGEGQWDGVPMATLMRRALEECSTLEEVMALWKNNPRTCEYYYVFADGKTNRAVGVSALPDSIEFILPGQTHPRLGDGIEDAVVLSAGSRLEKLRERVTQKHGQIDAEVGKWLMSRPVAMKSNLHNVLFVPADGILYVANADHKHPAAERPYAKLDLRKLLSSMDEPPAAALKSTSSESASSESAASNQ
ncbi:MAG: peptidase C45 acyl-coenzyme A:6-aminopenicillanic acid acyl-transferase [Rhodopirellula sp.]|nr:peptidase C45 acyl-coenzyme A:6-aminopenicillanic acid acyl-transferase [Rhodopirellula sp.]